MTGLKQLGARELSYKLAFLASSTQVTISQTLARQLDSHLGVEPAEAKTEEHADGGKIPCCNSGP